MTRPRAADDFPMIRARMEEFRRERARGTHNITDQEQNIGQHGAPRTFENSRYGQAPGTNDPVCRSAMGCTGRRPGGRRSGNRGRPNGSGHRAAPATIWLKPVSGWRHWPSAIFHFLNSHNAGPLTAKPRSTSSSSTALPIGPQISSGNVIARRQIPFSSIAVGTPITGAPRSRVGSRRGPGFE